MATVKFFTVGKTNPITIYVRFLGGRKFDLKRTTSLIIDPKYWNSKKGIVKPASEFKDKQNIELRLNRLKSEILEKYNKDYTNGILINADWLQNVILQYFKQDKVNSTKDFNAEYLTDYADYHLLNLPFKVLKNNNVGVTKATYKKYKSNIVKLKEFEIYKKKRLLISDVNMEFHRDYIYYLKNEDHLNYNSIGKHLTMVKTICLDANATKGININNALLPNGKFKTTKEDTSFVTLNETEINTIFNHDFSKNESLNNARNWLIIGVWTGCRVSDLLKLTNENLKDEFIEYTAMKTGKNTIVPVHWQIKSIIENLNGNLPRTISLQKFNDYIKLVCDAAGINELMKGSIRINTGLINKKGKIIWRKIQDNYTKDKLVSTHICRRSFATNLYGKLPTPIIMSATGHGTEKMLLNYIGKPPKDNADVLMEYWKTVKTKQDKKAKKDKKAQFVIIKNAK